MILFHTAHIESKVIFRRYLLFAIIHLTHTHWVSVFGIKDLIVIRSSISGFCPDVTNRVTQGGLKLSSYSMTRNAYGSCTKYIFWKPFEKHPTLWRRQLHPEFRKISKFILTKFQKKTNTNMECSACYACPLFCNCVFRVSAILFKHSGVAFSQKFLVLLNI